jgi:phosphatidylglycerol lysyltransferase
MSVSREPVTGIEPHTSRRLSRFGTVLAVLLVVAAAWFLRRELVHTNWTAVLAEIRATPWSRLLLAGLCTAGSYLTLTGYDALAVRYCGRRLPYRRTALTAFMAYAIGNNIGVASLTGTPIRYRMYSDSGFSATDIVQIVVFCSVTFAVGTAFLTGASLLATPPRSLAALGLPLWTMKAVGATLLAGSAGYVVTTFVRRAPLQFGAWTVTLPTGPYGIGQLALSVLDLSLSAAVLYVLLAPATDVGFLAFLSVYLLALTAGMLSSIPAGIGAFEAVVLVLLPGIDREYLLGAILLYRTIYYLCPLTLALGVLAGAEAALHRGRLRRAGILTYATLAKIVPQAAAILVFLSGAVLLVSGSLPASEERLASIARLIPLPVLELSHLAGSAIGAALLIVAVGLYRRLRGAYDATMIALLLGIVASLLKGLDYEEAALLTVGSVVLFVARHEFRREAPFSAQSFSAAWIFSIAMVIGAAIWLGLFAFRHVQYSNELWWQFSLHADAPRMLRASVTAVVVALSFALWRAIRPTVPKVATAPADLGSAREILQDTSDSSNYAALSGDKRFLFDEERRAFVMYQVSGRSWVALRDPVGPLPQHESLCWRFLELADRYDGWPVFYQVSEKSLSLYTDLGLTLLKLGEEALIPLPEFDLTGKRLSNLRHSRSRLVRDGAHFEVVPRSQLPALMPELERVSDAWLESKGAAEKGFSLGAFSAEYLGNFDCAVVRVGGRIVAFANLWQAPAGAELSVDLMRHLDDAPNGVMDYLLTETIFWGKGHGFDWFNLGMAPLSGLEQHPLASVWHKAGNALFYHAEHFYNFEGLRRYKEKFEPVWKPRYLASRGGLALPRILFDISLLISGGFRPMVSK